MKTLLAISATIVGFAICGCNPDHSGDTQAPVTTQKQTAPPSAVDQNPNMPDSAKKGLNASLPPAPKGN